MADAHPALSPQNIKLKAQLQALGATPFYEKCLTNSDTGAHGRVVLPKAVAETQFAHFLETQGAPLVGEDINGVTYDFKFRFWTNNQSRMYLIEGCADLLKKYKLQFGDVIVFARKADGTLVLGGRPAGPEDAAKRPATRQRTSTRGDEKNNRAGKRRKDAPASDGYFRSCTTADVVRHVYPEGSSWACAIDVAGEPFRALFDLEADARAAFQAACPLEQPPPAAAAAAATMLSAPNMVAGGSMMMPMGGVGPAQAMAGGAAGPDGNGAMQVMPEMAQ